MLLQVPMLLRASASGRTVNGLRSHSLRSTCNRTLHGGGGSSRQSDALRQLQFAALMTRAPPAARSPSCTQIFSEPAHLFVFRAEAIFSAALSPIAPRSKLTCVILGWLLSMAFTTDWYLLPFCPISEPANAHSDRAEQTFTRRTPSPRPRPFTVSWHVIKLFRCHPQHNTVLR